MMSLIAGLRSDKYREIWGMAGFVLCFVIAYSYVNYGALFSLPFVLILALLGMVLNKPAVMRLNIYDWLVLLLNLSMTVSALVRLDFSVKVYATPLMMWVAWLLIRNYFRDEKLINGMLDGIVLVGVVLAVIGFYRAFALRVLSEKAGEFAGSINQTAMLIYLGTFAAFRGVVRKGGTWRVLPLLFLAVTLLSIPSRSSWLAFFTTSLVYFLMNSEVRSRYIRTLKIVTVVIPVVAVLMLFNDVSRIILKVVATKILTKGLSVRSEIWAITFNLWKESPVFGYSWASITYLDEHIPERILQGFKLSPHSSFLNYLLSGGIIAAALYLIIIFTLLYRLWRSSKTETNKAVTALLCGAVMISFFESLSLGGFILRNILFTLVCASAVALTPCSPDLPAAFRAFGRFGRSLFGRIGRSGHAVE